MAFPRRRPGAGDFLGPRQLHHSRGAYPTSPGDLVTPGYVEGLAVRPFLGRGFVQTDFERTSMAVLISHRLWQGVSMAIRRSSAGRPGSRERSPQRPETFTVIGVSHPAWHMNVFTEAWRRCERRRIPTSCGCAQASTGDRRRPHCCPVRPRAGLPAAGVWSFGRPMRPMCSRSTVAPGRGHATGLVLLIACATSACCSTVRATRRRARWLSVRPLVRAPHRSRVRAPRSRSCWGRRNGPGLHTRVGHNRGDRAVMNHYLGVPRRAEYGRPDRSCDDRARDRRGSAGHRHVLAATIWASGARRCPSPCRATEGGRTAWTAARTGRPHCRRGRRLPDVAGGAVSPSERGAHAARGRSRCDRCARHPIRPQPACLSGRSGTGRILRTCRGARW